METQLPFASLEETPVYLQHGFASSNPSTWFQLTSVSAMLDAIVYPSARVDKRHCSTSILLVESPILASIHARFAWLRPRSNRSLALGVPYETETKAAPAFAGISGDKPAFKFQPPV